MDVPPVMPISKKAKPWRGFKYPNMEERLHIMSSEERNHQISGKEVEKLEKPQLITQRDDDGNNLEPLKWLIQGSLGTKSNLYGVQKPHF